MVRRLKIIWCLIIILLLIGGGEFVQDKGLQFGSKEIQHRRVFCARFQGLGNLVVRLPVGRSVGCIWTVHLDKKCFKGLCGGFLSLYLFLGHVMM